MKQNEEDLNKKKPYSEPKLIVHGDVDAITLGTDLGESLDAAFTTSSSNPRGNKQPRQSAFS
ncbi:MAG TPA: hypothetical protein VIB00_10990 [Pyrinomonadaceae bacterium]|jgi:hypothetical protein